MKPAKVRELSLEELKTKGFELVPEAPFVLLAEAMGLPV